jgi:hypothetical protein
LSGLQKKNGDATLLPKGTKIYKVKGYAPDFRLIAGDQLYEASHNPKAKILADFYDIEGRVERISLESTADGFHIKDFSREATARFMEELLKLDYVGFDEIYNVNLHINSDNLFHIILATLSV